MSVIELVLATSRSPWASILVKVTVTTALALAVARLAANGRAAVRHLLLAAAFAVLATLPIAAIVVPAMRVPLPGSVQEAVGPPAIAPMVQVEVPAAPADTGRAVTGASEPARWGSLSQLMFAGWMAGASLCLLPVIIGLGQMRSLRRSSLPWRQGQSVVDRMAREAGIRRRVGVLVHESIAGPVTCGLAHPVIVLPGDARTWANEDLRRAIVHELAHVRRGDWVSQGVARVTCACYWFHPLVWTAQRQLVLEAERACDDAVLRDPSTRLGAGTDPVAYADQLVALATRLSATPKVPLLAMANRRHLAARVASVLDTRQSRGRAGTSAAALVSAAAALLVTTLSPLQIVAGTPSAAAADTSVQATAKFDVASIKPCKTGDLPPGARGANLPNGGASPGRLHVECQPLAGPGSLIRQAYGSFASGTHNAFLHPSALPVEGGPAWVRTDRYTIDAKAVGTPSVEMMHGPMLQALLEDRFSLKIRRETREVPVYDLTVAKGGSKLKAFDGRCKPVDFTKGNIPAQLEADGACPVAMRDTKVDAPGQTIFDFITFVLALMDRPVVDRTGLTGRFDIYLSFPAGDSHDPQDVSVTLAAAVQQQLGLKLSPAKGPGPFLVIDRVERPAPDAPADIADVPARARGAR